LAAGALDSVTLMERVCALPRAPERVAERLAEALFARHADFGRDSEGRWCLSPRAAPRSPDHLLPTVGERSVRERRVVDPDRGTDVGLADVPFAVVDVETTGTSAGRGDRVTEIAIVHVHGGVVSDVFETLVNPERAIPPAIVALTRITQEMVQGAPRFPAVSAQVVGQLRSRVFVAHNASFDWRFVSHEVQRSAGVTLMGERLCTVRLARCLLPHLPRRSLDSVTHYFGIEIGARHRAAGDAIATAQVLVRLLRLAEDRGVTTWRDLAALLAGGRSARTRRRSALPRGVDLDTTA